MGLTNPVLTRIGSAPLQGGGTQVGETRTVF
jgi:hypothetical protein